MKKLKKLNKQSIEKISNFNFHNPEITEIKNLSKSISEKISINLLNNVVTMTPIKEETEDEIVEGKMDVNLSFGNQQIGENKFEEPNRKEDQMKKHFSFGQIGIGQAKENQENYSKQIRKENLEKNDYLNQKSYQKINFNSFLKKI